SPPGARTGEDVGGAASRAGERRAEKRGASVARERDARAEAAAAGTRGDELPLQVPAVAGADEDVRGAALRAVARGADEDRRPAARDGDAPAGGPVPRRSEELTLYPVRPGACEHRRRSRPAVRIRRPGNENG